MIYQRILHPIKALYQLTLAREQGKEDIWASEVRQDQLGHLVRALNHLFIVQQDKCQLYQKMFQKNVAPKLLIDPSTGAIVDANPAASRFYGYSIHKLRTINICQINTATAEDVAIEMQNAANEQRCYFRFIHRLADGQLKEVEVFSGPVHYEGRMLLYSIVHDVSAQQELQRHLFHLAHHDELTSLFNRRYLMNYLERKYKEKHNFGLIMFDIDFFKKLMTAMAMIPVIKC
ncbi:PAS domain S-box-containing protein [Allopseudospirillum japonicum]|uniref:PAS domain S-box-containing protein n=1 Tax=Allopseudospirillum japonicum TaxID=64971 RepID=A0A1H6R9J0_9GAMM|nr:PAS domain S-box-containing protein [Allopseudospirillum japonicum]